MVNLKSCYKQITLTVRITTEFKIRRKIAVLLIRLAAWVLKANVEVINGR